MSIDDLPKKPSLIRKVALLIGRTTLTLTIAGMAVGLGVAGFTVLSSQASEAAGPDPAPYTTVAPKTLKIEDKVVLKRRFTGQFEAAQDITLGFEEPGRILNVLVREGDRVAQGAVLAQLDTSLLEAEKRRLIATRQSMAANVELSRRTNERQTALLESGHVSQQRVDETSLRLLELEASMAEIDAAIAVVDLRLDKTEITAPFQGTIGSRILDAGAVVGAGTGVLTILEDAPVRFRVAIDPDLANQLSLDDVARVATPSGPVAARLTEIAPELDPATRGQVVFFELSNEQGVRPKSRASGEIELDDVRAETGAWIELSALRQGPRGTWTFLTVAQTAAGTSEIMLEAAEILHIDSGRAFVRGTFEDGVQYLASGTHRVVPGEPVLVAGAGS